MARLKQYDKQELIDRSQYGGSTFDQQHFTDDELRAAAQAQNYYASQIADKIPELEQLAYQKYLDDASLQQSKISALQGQEQLDYAKYIDALGQYNTDRNFDYGVYSDRYNQLANNLGLAANQQSTQYSMETAAQGDALDRVQNFLKAGGKLADLDATLIARSGLTPAELKTYEAYYANQSSGGSGGSGGRGGRGGSGSGSASSQKSANDRTAALRNGSESAARALFNAAKKSGAPQSYIANHYKEYGFDKSTGLTADYKKWLAEQDKVSGYDRTATPSSIAGLGSSAGNISLDYSPDEGVFTFNGRVYSNINSLADAIERMDLTPSQKKKLQSSLRAYGFDISF